jgi:hypothetical protein
MLVEVGIDATITEVGEPPFSVPVPAVAVNALPTANPEVVDIFVTVADHGLPRAVATVSVRLFSGVVPPRLAPGIVMVLPTAYPEPPEVMVTVIAPLYAVPPPAFAMVNIAPVPEPLVALCVTPV